MSEVEPTKSDAALREEEILKFWDDNKIFEKSLNKPATQGEFVFYDGPATANAKPVLHTMEPFVFKDLLPRYKTMRGFHVIRQVGWDTHGLPVELQIEKKLGFASKKDIEDYGIEKFNKLCKESVWEFIGLWKEYTQRIGYWADQDHPYITYENSYIESVWNVLKTVDEKKLLYKDFKVVPWCPRDETALSSHELAQGYQEDKDLSVTVKFKVTNPEKIGLTGDVFLLAWTTTPWTLPGNVALAVGKDIEYVLAKVLGKIEGVNNFETQEVIIAKDRLETIHGQKEIFGEFKGSDLVSLEYQALFPELKTHLESSIKEEFSNHVNGWKVYAADFVNTTEGTGIVHIAPMYGMDDFDLATKNKLPKLHTVDQSGNFVTTLVPEFLKGRFVKEVDENGKPTVATDIIDYLIKEGFYYDKYSIKHQYPHCWRCKTPLIYYARDSWYIKMSSLRGELLAENEKINWEPSYIKEGRFGEWLREVKDWAISRERYWGTPLPIWLDTNGNYRVIGSLAELKSLAKNPADIEKLDLHRPFIDEIELIDEHGDKLTRVKEVMDVWFDSGSMPFASGTQGYPADFISEAIDQTRGWFYTLHAIGTLMGKGAAYKNVICLGHILDKDGKKMSKSVGNVIDPWRMINTYGADPLRLWMYTITQPGDSKNFDEKTVDEAVKKVFNPLENILSFYELYKDENIETSDSSDDVLDRWIISRLNELLQKGSAHLDAYEVFEAARLIRDFINDFSTWYIRRSRDRFKSDNPEEKTPHLQQLNLYWRNFPSILHRSRRSLRNICTKISAVRMIPNQSISPLGRKPAWSTRGFLLICAARARPFPKRSKLEANSISKSGSR